MTGRSSERRRSRRLTLQEEHQVVSARVRPGYDVAVVNLSAGGALLEGAHRLLPGTGVELQLRLEGKSSVPREGRDVAIVRGRVLRCAVWGVRPNAMCYRGAIVFDQHLPWFVAESDRDRTSGVERRLALEVWE